MTVCSVKTHLVCREFTCIWGVAYRLIEDLPSLHLGKHFSALQTSDLVNVRRDDLVDVLALLPLGLREGNAGRHEAGHGTRGITDWGPHRHVDQPDDHRGNSQFALIDKLLEVRRKQNVRLSPLPSLCENLEHTAGADRSRKGHNKSLARATMTHRLSSIRDDRRQAHHTKENEQESRANEASAMCATAATPNA
eukprot:3252383-Rhodomonas_salina.1